MTRAKRGLIALLALGTALPASASLKRGQFAVCAANLNSLESAEGESLFLVGAYSAMNPHLGPETWKSFVDAVAGRMNYMRLEAPLATDYPYPQPYMRVPGSGLTYNRNKGKFDLRHFKED